MTAPTTSHPPAFLGPGVPSSSEMCGALHWGRAARPHQDPHGHFPPIHIPGASSPFLHRCVVLQLGLWESCQTSPAPTQPLPTTNIPRARTPFPSEMCNSLASTAEELPGPTKTPMATSILPHSQSQDSILLRGVVLRLGLWESCQALWDPMATSHPPTFLGPGVHSLRCVRRSGPHGARATTPCPAALGASGPHHALKVSYKYKF